MINTPPDLESYVQYVYTTLLNLKDEGVIVSRNAIMVGRSGIRHEIDVFYQFERVGVTHKVAFECKFTARPTEKADLLEFHSKINDLGNVQAICVSKSGFQRGAIDYASHYGIQLLTLAELPTLGVLMAKRIEAVALPSAHTLGEPFWLLMEFVDGTVNGVIYSFPQVGNSKDKIIPLFFSKRDAADLLHYLKGEERFVIRGVPQRMLKFLIGTARIGESKTMFSLMYFPPENGVWEGVPISPMDLEARYYYGHQK